MAQGTTAAKYKWRDRQKKLGRCTCCAGLKEPERKDKDICDQCNSRKNVAKRRAYHARNPGARTYETRRLDG